MVPFLSLLNTKEKIEKEIERERKKLIPGYILIVFTFLSVIIVIYGFVCGLWIDHPERFLVLMLWYSLGIVLSFQINPVETKNNIHLLELIKESIENESIEQDKDSTGFEKQEQSEEAKASDD